MSDRPRSWLERWSRRKRASAVAGEEVPSPNSAPVTAATPPPSTQLAPPPSTQTALPPSIEVPADLPEVEGLTAASDFTPFLRADVPTDLHQRALRKLWTSDPVYGYRDGLTDYDEDYTAIGIVEQVVETAYRVGSGYERSAAEGEGEEPSAATADDEGAPPSAAGADPAPAALAGGETPDGAPGGASAARSPDDDDSAADGLHSRTAGKS